MNSDLLQSLRNGGYILYTRHGESTIGQDQPIPDFRDCNTQRNLSELGRQQALHFGERLRALSIPVAYPVSASPFCRAVESAQLAFGQHSVVPDPFWYAVYRLSSSITPAEQQATLSGLRARLETIPPPGTNQVIIAHGFPSGIGLGQIPDMGTVVVRPLGRGRGYEIAARLSPGDLD
jgi:hypothetical protein